jgi:prepilin-type N-terminal cleavage/methylation domain-containing protein
MTKMQRQNVELGFTLVELMVSMAVGLIVMAAMASLFKTGMDSTLLVTQRAETQQNMRAAIDLMTKDISLAGAGLPSGGIPLPTGGTATTSKYGCDQSGACHVPNHTYPNNNHMYGIIPGFLNGVEASAVIPAAPAPAVNDSVTVVYADYNFPLNEYDMTFNSTASGANVTLAVDALYTASPPPGITCAGGINAGDLIMVAGGGLTAVGEVTNLTSSATAATCGNGQPATGTMTFANGDPLNINQDGATSGNLKAIAANLNGGTAVAYRIYVVTYYLSVPAAAGQTPRLMRQVNGLAPVPVADDIINLQFAYDVYNSTNDALDSNQPNPLGALESPNNIQKVNLIMMGQSIINDGKKSQNMYLATDVSARNMAFRNRYK